MQGTPKPKGLENIWGKIKKIFQNGCRDLYHAVLCLAYKKTGKTVKICLSEAETTALIIQNTLCNRELWETWKHSPKNKNQDLFDAKTWNEFCTPERANELSGLYHRLTANTDELSRELASYFIAKRQFAADYGFIPTWNIAPAFFSFTYPLAYQASKRLEALEQSYKCPYRFPKRVSSFRTHMSLGFGLNQFSLEDQERVVDKDIIDGGAYSGDSAMTFTEYNPRKVYSFEPNPDAQSLIRQVLNDNANILGDKKESIELVPLALGRAKGTSTLFTSGGSDGGATLSQQVADTSHAIAHKVDIISIDEFVQERSLNVGLIKLDVEGMEYETILGAKETISQQKPLLLVSLYHTFRDFFEIKPTIESWDLGYQFCIRRHELLSEDMEFQLMAY